MGPSRRFWNGTTSALQPEEITSKGLEFHVCTINKSAHTKKISKLIVCTSYIYSEQRVQSLVWKKRKWVDTYKFGYFKQFISIYLSIVHKLLKLITFPIIFTNLSPKHSLHLFSTYVPNTSGSSGGAMVSKLNYQTNTSEFESHSVPSHLALCYIKAKSFVNYYVPQYFRPGPLPSISRSLSDFIYLLLSFVEICSICSIE